MPLRSLAVGAGIDQPLLAGLLIAGSACGDVSHLEALVSEGDSGVRVALTPGDRILGRLAAARTDGASRSRRLANGLATASVSLRLTPGVDGRRLG